ncbi:fasciclin domain-containing protein [Carboxylicivirga caseinilyticus]|uniref:fasciclin domain-containing protein n=1 Tax=Carboxylicivirga caseinilyticus TaxID=3417572 RepID=UPI003D33607C|nr:fasciclin domain-containing protein [Marinilabiliaceae bacterium A049]
MKALKMNYWVLALFVGLMFVTVSCDDEDDKTMEDNPIESSQSITAIAASNNDFSILVSALQKVGLDDDLDQSGDFTVFAPTNSAFNSLLDELGVSSLDDISDEVLTEVLLYHVMSGSKMASNLQTGYYNSLSAGPMDGYMLSFYVDMSTLKINNRAMISQTDIEAANGVIHVIDKVILPMSITDHAISNENFSSLVSAVVKAELAETLDSDENQFTVFAPVNSAFDSFLESNDLTFDALTKETLTPILLYHVLGNVIPASMVESGYVSTLASAFDNNINLKVDVADAVMLNSSAKVIVTDVVATNGIIHAIDQVIVPPTIVDIALQNSNFSILVDALIKAELVDDLSGDGPFTVFAPTNDAFEDLFEALQISSLDDLSKEDLIPVLLAHVVSANAVSTGLTNGTVPTLNAEKEIMVNVDNGVIIDNSIKVVAADIQGLNGVIHVIDQVIVP